MPSTSSRAADARAKLVRYERWANMLDTRYRVFGVPIGWDSILGLIPGVGDAVTVLPTAAMVHAGYRAGIRKRALARMTANAAADLLIGSIPFVGDLFDMAFKSHTKNAGILREEFTRLDLV